MIQVKKGLIMKKVILGILGFLVLVVLIIAIVYGPTLGRFLSSSTEYIDANLTIFLGYGGNSIVLKSDDGSEILIVDTKMAGGATKLREHVDAISKEARITVVNTHHHPDHAGGNKRFPEARFLTGVHDRIPKEEIRYKATFPDDPLTAGEERILTIGRDTVHVRSMGQGHSWNDVTVYLKNRKLLVTGDLIFNGWHPALFKSGGSSVQGWINSLTRLIEEYDIDIVVPGHGPLTDRQALLNQREYFVSIGEAIGNEARLKELKKKYKGYTSLPMTSGFDKTRRFIEEERMR